MEYLTIFTFVMLMITLISLLNERFFRIPNDIALLLFSFSACVTLRIVDVFVAPAFLNRFMDMFRNFQFETYLLDGVLCYMLFAGAGQVHFLFLFNLRPHVHCRCSGHWNVP